MYSNNDENIVIVINISGIIEIPLEWDVNRNLELAAASLSPPEQLCDDDGEPISVLQHALTYSFRRMSLDRDLNHYYSITYEGMTWESQELK